MNTDIEQLQLKLSKDVRGVLWFSKVPLDSYPRPFRAFNYFLDGLLLKNQMNMQQSLNKNLYCSRSFGRSFFLGFIKADTAPLEDEVLTLMEWVRTQIDEGDTILVLDQTQKKIDKALRKKYPNIVFEKLKLEN